MAKYITFTVTPADGSPYEFWINANASGNTCLNTINTNPVTGDVLGARAYSIFSSLLGTANDNSSSSTTMTLYAVPVGTPSTNVSNVMYPSLWYSKAVQKARMSNSDEIFVKADGLPPAGISAITGVCPTLP